MLRNKRDTSSVRSGENVISGELKKHMQSIEVCIACRYMQFDPLFMKSENVLNEILNLLKNFFNPDPAEDVSMIIIVLVVKLLISVF